MESKSNNDPLYEYILTDDVKKEVLAKGEPTTTFNTPSMSKLVCGVFNNPFLKEPTRKILTAIRDGRCMYV